MLKNRAGFAATAPIHPLGSDYFSNQATVALSGTASRCERFGRVLLKLISLEVRYADVAVTASAAETQSRAAGGT